MEEPDRRPVNDEERAQIDGWINWVAQHSNPPAALDGPEAIMDQLTAILSQDFVTEYGMEEHFAMGIAWGEALRRKHDGWAWVSVPAESGRTLALDVSADEAMKEPQSLVAPGHLIASRADQEERLDPRMLEAMLMQEIAA